MSIDSLNKAARAAGFAMATPDEEATAESRAPVSPEAAGRALVPVAVAPVRRAWAVDTLAGLLARMRTVMPSFGGRAPA